MRSVIIFVTDDGAEYEHEIDAVEHEMKVAAALDGTSQRDKSSRKSFLFIGSGKEKGARWPTGSWADAGQRLYVWSCVAPLETAIQLAVSRLKSLHDKGIHFVIDEDVRISTHDNNCVDEKYIGDRPELQEWFS